VNNFESITEFEDDNNTTFIKLDVGLYDYKFSYYDSVSKTTIEDYCDLQQLYDWGVVVTKVIK
jgi:hypothetical protein